MYRGPPYIIPFPLLTKHLLNTYPRSALGTQALSSLKLHTAAGSGSLVVLGLFPTTLGSFSMGHSRSLVAFLASPGLPASGGFSVRVKQGHQEEACHLQLGKAMWATGRPCGGNAGGGAGLEAQALD
ncbi:hypothetical protein E2C01_004527 [Portunus trituberculatus]|uniref:Uncharacterized protein n=1 Tax=Portunus trituberculatus TaxID=210409 RepID=A0A5B7CQ84_PORTR|nr:hypothetical protein [Portunus trituberculatus]